MFHWICPECGQEIAPGVKECPVCEPGSEPQSSAAPLPPAGHSVAVAPAPEVAAIKPVPVSAVAVLEPPPPVEEPQVVLEPEIVLQPEVVLHPEIVLLPKQEFIPEAQSSQPSAPLPEPETFADRLADLAERLHGEHIPYTAEQSTAASRAHAEETEERTPVIVPMIIDVTPSRPLLAPPPSMRLLAEPQPPSVAAGFSAREVFHPRPAEHPIRSHPPHGRRAVRSRAGSHAGSAAPHGSACIGGLSGLLQGGGPPDAPCGGLHESSRSRDHFRS